MENKEITKYEATAKDMWGNNLSAVGRKIIAEIAVAFGLNPALQHLTVLKGNIYVTHAGLTHYATNTGRVLPKRFIKIVKDSPDDYECEAIIYVSPYGITVLDYIKELKSIGIPLDEILETMKITARGRANKKNVTMSTILPFIPEIAEKRAYNRAYRQAFGIGICSAEEMKEQEEITENESPTKAKNITPSKKEIPKKQAETKNNGNGKMTDEQKRKLFHQFLNDKYIDKELMRLYLISHEEIRQSTNELKDKMLNNMIDRYEDFKSHFDSWLKSMRELTPENSKVIIAESSCGKEKIEATILVENENDKATSHKRIFKGTIKKGIVDNVEYYIEGIKGKAYELTDDKILNHVISEFRTQYKELKDLSFQVLF